MSIHPVKLMRPIRAGILKSGSFRAAQLTGNVRCKKWKNEIHIRHLPPCLRYLKLCRRHLRAT